MSSRRIAAGVETDLRALIAQSFPPGSQIPAERELAQLLNVSRPTLREVVSMLARAGELDRRWGIGTFVPVDRRPFVVMLNTAVPLRKSAELQGFSASVSSASVELIPATSEAREIWDLGADARVWQLGRALILDGRPAMHLVDTVPEHLNGRTLDLADFGASGDADFIPYIYERSGLLMTALDTTIGAALALDDEIARLMDVEIGAPLLTNTHVGRTEDGQPVTHTSVHSVPGRILLQALAIPRRSDAETISLN